MAFFRFLFISVLILSLFSCAKDAGEFDPDTGLQLNESASGQQIEAHVGQTIRISLSENPSTGFRWNIEKHDPAILALQSNEYESAADAVIGQPGTRHMVFVAQKPGSTVLDLAYYRPWEHVEKTATWFQIIVQVIP